MGFCLWHGFTFTVSPSRSHDRAWSCGAVRFGLARLVLKGTSNMHGSLYLTFPTSVFGRYAKHRPAGATEGEAAGLGNATSGSLTDRLTREHRMTVDEAQLILNVKREAPLEEIVKVRTCGCASFRYEVFTFVSDWGDDVRGWMGSVRDTVQGKLGTCSTRAGKRGGEIEENAAPAWSHYLQSKVVRARERLEAEAKVAAEDGAPKEAAEQTTEAKDVNRERTTTTTAGPLMGVLMGALGALGAMLVPMERGVETHSVVVVGAVVAVVLILAYVTNPSAASFRTFLTELAFRRHLSKLHDASEADPPALTWARHSLAIDAPPHLQFATKASVSVRSSAHIFRSFGIFTIAAVTPVADHRNKPDSHPTAFASDHGRWFLGAFGKWWFGGALLLGKGDDGTPPPDYWTSVCSMTRSSPVSLFYFSLFFSFSPPSRMDNHTDSNGRRTPPPLPKHASLPLHTQPTQKQSKPKPKSKPKSKSKSAIPGSTTEPALPAAPSAPTATNIDAHPLLADLLQHIATTQAALTTLAPSSPSSMHPRPIHASQKTLANVQATHAALEQRAKTLTEQTKSLHDQVVRDRDRKEELRKIEEEIMGSQEDKDTVGLIGKVRALEAEVKEARKTLDELKAWQANIHQAKEDHDEPEQEFEREKEPAVVYIGQTPVRSSLANASQSNLQRIHGTPSHARISSVPGIGHPASISSQNVTAPTGVASPTPAAPADVASPARSARSKGYAIFDNDLASLGGPKGQVLNTKKSLPGPIVGKAPATKGVPASGLGLSAPVAKDFAAARPAFSPFDSDTLPIAIPKRSTGNYALGPDRSAAKYGPSPDMLTFGLAMDSPTAGAFSPPPSALLPSSLLSEDGHRWEGDGAPSPPLFSDSQTGSSPVQLMRQNSTSPGQYRNGASPPRWEKDADGWVTEAKPVSNGWDAKPTIGSAWDAKTNGTWDRKQSNGNTWDNGFVAGDMDVWTGETNGSAGWTGEARRRWPSESAAAWAPLAEGRPRSLSNGSPAGRPRSDSHDAHRLSTGADSGYHSTVAAPKKRGSGSSSGEDVAQDTSASSFALPFLQSSPVPPGSAATRRGYDAQRASLPARVPLIREVEESEPTSVPAPAEPTAVPTKSRRWFSGVGSAKKEDPNARVQKSELNPDAKAFSFSPDASRIFNFTRGRTFNLGPPSTPTNSGSKQPAASASVTTPAPAPAPAPTYSPFGLGAGANASTPTLGSAGTASNAFFSSLLAFAPSPAEREALQRALGPNNGLTRTLSGTSARSPFTSPLPSARSSAVDLSLSDKAALAWNIDSAAAPVQKRTWFPVRKKAAVVEEAD
ncbi:hypothetical protein RHS01_03874 [Rhizoctonia solani]|uniref:Uncharacterized protein n=1 Tax=Rhizoctonia solani TaxID=456999 RepID=A0A8H7M6X7_9AGAM|nr:hypothetical protein RHS01_03874 [Rhizoctonia solani]